MQQVSLIPDHILVIIFSYLDSKDINSARLVSRHWNHLIVNFWSSKEKVTLKKYIENPEIFEEYAGAVAKRHPNVNELTLEPVDTTITPPAIGRVPEHYSCIGRLFTRLEKLVIYDAMVDVNALAAIAKLCPKLKRLSLLACSNISDLGLIKALRHAHLLDELEVVGCPELTTEIAVHFRNLSSLIYDECPFDEETWTALSDAGGKNNLEKLATTPFKYEHLCFISQKFPKLKQLFIPEFDDQDTFTRERFVGFPLLETIILTYGSVSDSEALTCIIKKCPSLKNVWIWNCVNANIEAFIDEVMGILKDKVDHLIIDDIKMKQLEKMNLRHFGNLKKLTLLGLKLTNPLVQRLIDGCPSLNFLDISDCVPPTPIELKVTHQDFWLNCRFITKKASCINLEPPFRWALQIQGESYVGPTLELKCDKKALIYHYRKPN